ncbi:MAG: DNA-binding transcriptional regulator Fis [Ectothiorhodospiraceae bacterium]|nr:DNA-binding transcriptional regulator Fis [Ectothiorhodospiraceae bacterium]
MNEHARRIDEQLGSCPAPEAGTGPIRACVADALDQYLSRLNGHECSELYKLVLQEVEPPLLEAVLRYCQGNQTRAARMLGINRATLRKKLVHYGLSE